jgi:hypothetical protein
LNLLFRGHGASYRRQPVLQESIDIQRDTQIEVLKQLTKRDEILFSKLHEIRAKHVEELYKKFTNFNNVGTSYLPGRHVNQEDKKNFSKAFEILGFTLTKLKFTLLKFIGISFIAGIVVFLKK